MESRYLPKVYTMVGRLEVVVISISTCIIISIVRVSISTHLIKGGCLLDVLGTHVLLAGDECSVVLLHHPRLLGHRDGVQLVVGLGDLAKVCLGLGVTSAVRLAHFLAASETMLYAFCFSEVMVKPVMVMTCWVQVAPNPILLV